MKFIKYDGWVKDLQIVVKGGAKDQNDLDAAVARLRKALNSND